MTEGKLFNLQRFLSAQDPVFATALRELQSGRKQSHWMWFVFPQLRGLGRSPTAQFYGLASLEEARAYCAHPVLGQRLITSTQAVLAQEGMTLQAIFGTPDDLKFRSCVTLFDRAAEAHGNVFRKALERFYGGRADERTLALLNAEPA